MKKTLLLLTGLTLILFTSCNIEEEGISEERIIRVKTVYGQQLITGFDIPFTAEDGAGNDITAQATFYVSGQAVTGNTFNFDQTGTYQVTAQLSLDGQTLTSAPYEVNVIQPRHTTKILVDDYTGTWCTNCPRVAYKLEQAVNQNHHIIPVAIHKGRFTGDDPFHYEEVNTLTSHFGINSFPSPLINRTMNYIWDENFSTLQTELDQAKPLGLAISSTANASNLDIEVKVRFDMDYTQGNLSLVVALLESNLIHEQANATSYYGGQDPIPDFEHNHVLRHSFTHILGDAIPASQCAVNQEYAYNFSGSVSTDYNLNNCAIVAFVIDNNDPSKLINIQIAEVGSVQDYD